MFLDQKRETIECRVKRDPVITELSPDSSAFLPPLVYADFRGKVPLDVNFVSPSVVFVASTLGRSASEG
jgi:hypothetical protein